MVLLSRTAPLGHGAVGGRIRVAAAAAGGHGIGKEPVDAVRGCGAFPLRRLLRQLLWW